MPPTQIGTPLTPLAPPAAAREPRVTRLHGIELHDDYAWLRDKGSPRVTQYLEAENAFTAHNMAGTETLQRDLYDEILSHIQEDDTSVPYRDGPWEYITRTEKGQQYARYCRRPVINNASNEAAETVILDVNELALKDGIAQPFMSIGASAISPDGHLLAYTTDNTGFRQYTLHIKDLRTNEHLPDTAERVGSLAWAADSQTLFYATEDEQTKREDRLFRRTVNSTQPSAEVFHEPDERFNLGIGRTRDRKFLILGLGSHTTTESWYLPTDKPTANFTRIAERIDDEEYDVDHREGFFYIRTNRDAEQFKLVRAPVDNPDRDSWQELLPEHPDAPLRDIDLFQTFLVASYRERGLPVLRVFALDNEGRPTNPQTIHFPDPAYSAGGEINVDFHATTYRYAYQALARPASVFRYNLPTAQSTLLKQQPVPGNFNADLYDSERLWFRANDGTDVPISLVYRKDLAQRPASSLAATMKVEVIVPEEYLGAALAELSARRGRIENITVTDGALITATVPQATLRGFSNALCANTQGRGHFTASFQGFEVHPASPSQNPLAGNPLYIYGYGSYGYPLPLGFSAARLALLDRGLVVAYAHIRGGGELGDPWHDAGKMMCKQNTFTDFIQAVEYLLTEGFGDPSRVAIEGGSAGGLLMGAVTNMRPHLFRAVLSHVPFVDVLNTMLDATLPLTVGEYEEWGNPNQPEAFHYMRTYSPYDNLTPGPYPAILVKTSLNDSQVMYWEPAKYTAKLRTLKTNPDTPLLLHTNMDAGHGGASGRYDYLRETAFDYAFLLRELGVATP